MQISLKNKLCTWCGSATSGSKACTGRCGRGLLEPVDFALESALLLALGQQSCGASRQLKDALPPELQPHNAAEHERAWRAARRLWERGALEIILQGEPVREWPGLDQPLELRLPRTA